LLIALIICSPGVLVMLGLWAYIARTRIGSALEGLAARLEARPPIPGDPEERELRNVVEEMAIAAGIEAPRVLLVDHASLNAAVIGASFHRSTVLVTRGVLDGCDRDETQAIAGHLVAMIANGDARATARLVAAFTAMGVVRKLLQVPIDRETRERMGRLIGYLRRREGEPDPRQEGELLEWLLEEDELDDMGTGIRAAVLLPFFMTYAMFNAVALMTTWLFLTPVLVPLLRSRRFLGDATAIQLNRNPQALGSALVKLGGKTAVGFPIGGIPDLLFAVAPGEGKERKASQPPFIVDLHPSISKRCRRAEEIAHRRVRRSFTERMSAMVGPNGVVAFLVLVVSPLAATAAFLMLWLVVALTGLALIVGMVYAGIVAGLVNIVVR
jgi:Zn-dependent protease with chaperone function